VTDVLNFQAANPAITGQGIRVAILDTGIAVLPAGVAAPPPGAPPREHPDLLARINKANLKSFVTGESVEDLNGHGSHCAGTACGPLAPGVAPRYGIAYGAELFVGKVLSNGGSGDDTSVLAGIEWALANGCHVISMSLSSVARLQDPPSRVYERVAQRALAQNALIVAAAGNNGPGMPVNRPANCPSILAVGAVDAALQVASFSARGLAPAGGGAVDLVAPGVNVHSSWRMPQRYNRISGTSMATPHVAGIAALIAQATGLRGKALWNHLVARARPLSTDVAAYGAGLVQAAR
jgi:subtilisin family serine protease